MIRDDNIYFVDIANHDLFNVIPEKLLQIADRNWPFLLDTYEMKGIHPHQNFSNAEGMDLIKKGATIMYNINGRCIAPIGGGIVVSGHSADSISISSYLLNKISFYRNSLENNNKKIIRKFRKQGVSYRILKFGIKTIDKNNIQFYEKQSNIELNLSQ